MFLLSEVLRGHTCALTAELGLGLWKCLESGGCFSGSGGIAGWGWGWGVDRCVFLCLSRPLQPHLVALFSKDILAQTLSHFPSHTCSSHVCCHTLRVISGGIFCLPVRGSFSNTDLIMPFPLKSSHGFHAKETEF